MLIELEISVGTPKEPPAIKRYQIDVPVDEKSEVPVEKQVDEFVHTFVARCVHYGYRKASLITVARGV